MYIYSVGTGIRQPFFAEYEWQRAVGLLDEKMNGTDEQEGEQGYNSSGCTLSLFTGCPVVGQ